MIEINLIPDVKNELLKTQSLRNRIILFSIVASIACVVLVVVNILGDWLRDLLNPKLR